MREAKNAREDDEGPLENELHSLRGLLIIKIFFFNNLTMPFM